MQSIGRLSSIPPAAYLYTLTLDPPSLAWEYLRRNPGYRSSFHRAGTMDEGGTPEQWCLRQWEDPQQDSREVEPSWLPCPGALDLVRMHELASLPRFDLWSMPGQKALRHESDHVSLTARVGGRMCRIKLAGDLGQGDCFAISIFAGRGFGARAQAAKELLKLGLPGAFSDKPRRPSPSAVTHMRILQVLDGDAAGATHREIARAVFGAFTDENWGADSVWRARVCYLLKRGQAHSAHGYRRMIGADQGGCGSSRREFR